MRNVYFWYAAQLAAVVFAVVFVRMSLVSLGGFMVAAQLAQITEANGGLFDFEGIAGTSGSPVPGDPLANAPPGRREGPIHEDLQRAGQLVIRDGQRVILVDDSDPENEIWVTLDGRLPVPWYAKNGWGPALAAILGGVGLYLVLWGLWTLSIRVLGGPAAAKAQTAG